MTHYIPTLKSKEGEYAALSSLNAGTRSRCTPLVELLPIPKPRAKADRNPKPAPTIEQWISRHAKFIGQASSTTHRVLVDFAYFPTAPTEDGRHPATALMASLNARHILAEPVISGSSPLPLVKALKGPWCSENGAALRLSPVDLDAGFDTIEVLLSFLGVSIKNVDLIADFGSISDASSVRIGSCNAALAHMATKPWRSVTFSAASFPMPLSHTGELVCPRYEWSVWQNLDADAIGREIGFADYGIRNISVPVEGGSRPTPNQRYALGDEWLVLRGKSLESYLWRELAIDLVNDSRYMKPSHCAGCRRWQEFADHGGPGATSTLSIQYGMIHHLTIVGQQLASLAAGTAAS